MYVYTMWVVKNIINLTFILVVVLSICDFKNIEAAVCVVYTSSMDLEVAIINSFTGFLHLSQPDKPIITRPGHGINIENHVSSNNIYM